MVWEDGVMSFVSTVRVRVNPGAGEQLEQLFQEHLLPARRTLKQQGDVLSMVLVRGSEPEDEYELITHWASKEAHDRNENSPAEAAVLRAAASLVAAPPSELSGTRVVEL